MFVDLTKTTMNSKIIVHNNITDGESVTLSQLSKTFTFKDNPTEDTDIAISMTTPTYASGFIKSFNNYDLKDNDYIDIGDKFGLSFSVYGVFGALVLKENASSGDYVRLTIGEDTFEFRIGVGESSDRIIYVNRGGTKSETAYFLSQAINNSMTYYGLFAINYDNTILMRKFTATDYKSDKNAFSKVSFNNVAAISDSFSFTSNGVNHVYQFGIGLGYINPGSDAQDSAYNLALAINEDVTKPAVAVAVDNQIYLYSTIFGSNGNVNTYCNTSGRFSASNFSGGSDSDLTIEFENNSIIFDTKKVASGVSGICTLGIASADAAIHSLSDDLVTEFDYVNFTSTIKYMVAGQNLPMYAYGGTVNTQGITGALDSVVDTEATASNLCNKLNTFSIFGINATYQGNEIDIVFNYLETISSSNRTKIDFVNYSSGSAEDPMSWNELLVYKETLGINGNLANLDIVFVKGELNSIENYVTFNNYRNSKLTINTLDSAIVYGNEFPFVFTNCDKIEVSISGKFTNNCDTLGEVGLVKLSNCTSSKCVVTNCENTQLAMQSLLVEFENCSMESSLEINNSTITQGDNIVNGNIFSVSGYVSVKSQFNIFEGNGRNVNNVVYLGSRCTYKSSYDCFSKITPTNSITSFSSVGSLGISEAEVDCDSSLVIDKNNTNPWSLNLTSNSRGLLISDNTEQPNDIYGNKRYLEKDLYKITIIVSDEVIGIGKFVDSNYIEIDSVKKFFKYDLPSSFSSKLEFARSVRDAFLSSKYKIGINVSSGSVVSLTMYGTNDIFNSNLGNYISIEYNRERNGVDAGSRQKHTIIDKSYDIDLSINTRTDKYFTIYDMENIVAASFPCYGNMTFNIINSNINNETLSFGFDNNGNVGEGYCNFKFVGSKNGKRYVPTLRADLKLASNKFLTFLFDGFIHIGSIEETINSSVENTFIDVIFVNSILKWDSSINLVTLRLLESTLVEKTSGASISVAKELIVNGCIIKCELESTDDNIKTIARYNYLVNGYRIESSDDSIDKEGTIVGEDCLVNSSGSTIDDFAIIDDSIAISHINSIDLISDPYVVKTDIVGNYRCSENVKESLDCGAYEKNIVFENSLNIVVNLDSESTGNGGKYAPCSLQEAYDKINSLEKIDIPIYIELSGYGSNIPKFEINKKFSDSGSINFIGEPNTVLDGCVDETAFVINSENALVSFSNIMFRNCNFVVDCRKVVFSSCAIVSSLEETLISGNSECYFYGCSIQTKTNAICGTESFVIGCSAQSSTNISIFSNINTSSGNVCYNCSIDSSLVLNSQIMNDAVNSNVMNSELFKLINDSAAGLVSVSDFGDLYEDAESYNYNEDIRGFYRFDENENTDSGCYDSLGVSDAGSYSDKPNGQFATITKEGSSLITRMMTGKVRFKIVGYSVGKGGYSRKNPVNSIPIKSNGAKAKYEITLSSNTLTNSDGIVVGNVEIRAVDDFEIGQTLEETIDILVRYINKNNSSFYAEKTSNSSLSMTAMTIGTYGNNAVSSLSSNIQVVQNENGIDSKYGIDICYPSDGYKEFEFIDHIPFAVSFFMRLNRKEFQSALGEVIVYAKIIKSELLAEEEKIIPFAVVRHGILTKDKDSIIVRRIVIQV